MLIQPLMSQKDRIEMVSGTIIPGSELEVDPSEIDSQGHFDPNKRKRPRPAPLTLYFTRREHSSRSCPFSIETLMTRLRTEIRRHGQVTQYHRPETAYSPQQQADDFWGRDEAASRRRGIRRRVPDVR
jgi:hypothetical protein